MVFAVETLAEVTRKLTIDLFLRTRSIRDKFPEWGNPEERQSIFSPSGTLPPVAVRETEPEQLLSSSGLPRWLVLGVATHCHIDDQIDALDQWDLQGFLSVPRSVLERVHVE